MTPRHQAYNLLHICISSPVFLYSVVSSHLQYLVAHSWFLIAVWWLWLFSSLTLPCLPYLKSTMLQCARFVDYVTEK